MKKALMLMLAVAMVGFVLPAARAADEGAGALVTQGELAQRLVEVTGLWRYIGHSKPTDAECFAALLSAGLSPSAQGWKADEPVTAAVLARILVQALGGAKGVPADQQDNPQAWMDALKGLLDDMNLIETVEGALSVLVPDNESLKTVLQWFYISPDELKRRAIYISDVTSVFSGGIVLPQLDVTPDFALPS